MGEPPVIASKNQFTLWVVAALVATRLMIGWHFFMEGASKAHDHNFSAVGFLGSATGPFAGMYHGILPDKDGLERLNLDASADGRDRVNVQRTILVWDIHRQKVADYYGFDQAQQRDSQRIFNQFKQQLTEFFLANSEEIRQYFQGLQRRQANAKDPTRREVPTLAEQSQQVQRELQNSITPLLRQLDALWAAYDRQLNGLATVEQKQRSGNAPLQLKKPGEVGSLVTFALPASDEIAFRSSFKLFDVNSVDRIIPCFDILIGTLLILGLFARFASILAALFLCSVIASQWPGSAGAMPTYNQAIELMALVILAATGAGRFAGLDFFIVHWQRCRDELRPVLARLKQRFSREAKNEPYA